MKKIFALFLVVMFVCSAMPVYAAEVESVQVQPRATIFNHANYLTQGQHESFYIAVPNSTNNVYTCTIVVDEMGGTGLQVNLQKPGDAESAPIEYSVFKGQNQFRIELQRGATYVLDVNARNNLAYSITISN